VIYLITAAVSVVKQNKFPHSLHAEIIDCLQDLNKRRVAEHSEIVTLNTCPSGSQAPRFKCLCAYRRRYWSYLLQLRTLTKVSVDSLTTARLSAYGCQFSIKLCLLFLCLHYMAFLNVFTGRFPPKKICRESRELCVGVFITY